MKTMFFAFRGDPLCFIHVLLNALDMHERGMGGEIILEGEAVRLVAAMADPGNFLHSHYAKARERGLIAGACRACSVKTGAVEAVEAEGIPLIGAMMGHPSMADYIRQGHRVLIF